MTTFTQTTNLKKLTAILLAAVLLFNWCGFQPLMYWLEHKADEQMTDRLDGRQYDESSLIEIAVATNLPYTNNWTDFERTDGSIEYNGQHYNYVMCRMVNGIMIYKCIPNVKRTQLAATKNNFLKTAFDGSQASNSQKSGSQKSLPIKKMTDDFATYGQQYPIGTSEIQRFVFTKSANLLTKGFLQNAYQPPEA